MNTVHTDEKDVMFVVTYGSRLYGTSTPKSDTDLKSVYLPEIDDLLLGKRLVNTKTRVDASGVKVADQDLMPADGVENEFIPFQVFVRDFVQGQTYAVEIAFAILRDGPTAPDPVSFREYELVQELVENFGNSEVYSMVSFAQKQTFDYVKRGERLNDARKVEAALRAVQEFHGATGLEVRLDLPLAFMRYGELVQTTVLDELARETGLKTSVSVNNNKPQRTLELNGRSYLESTTVGHILEQVKKLVSKYGDRSTAAAETDVDYKSLSHAVRVYQQSIELLETGKITFPRPNAAELLLIKQGSVPLDEVKSVLTKLDEEVLSKIETSSVRKKTPELVARSEQWLLAATRELYLL
jgi:hypothetical protein